MPNLAPGFQKNPTYSIAIEPTPARVRVELGGQVVAETTHAKIMREGTYPPVYYVPRADVCAELLAKTDHASTCPYKGQASYYTITAGGRVAENAIWSYETPYDECAAIKEYMAFYPDRVDAILIDGETMK